MGAQITKTSSGEELVVLPKAEFDAMRDALEDAEDDAAVIAHRASSGAHPMPFELVKRIDDAGEAPLAAVLAWRGRAADDLADELGVSSTAINDILNGGSEGSPRLWRRMAAALGVSVDLLLPPSPTA